MNYVNNAELLEEVRKYKNTGVQSEALGNMVLKIATKYADKGSFAGYSWKDDMIGEAVLTCVKYMHNFDTEKEKPNAFAYFSKIVHNAFLNFISKQKTHSAIKDICYKNIDFLLKDPFDEVRVFDVCGLDYQSIRGNKKRRKKKKKEEK
jgi:DNA-directed RNA polymerase specialized sigma24 family protein